MFHPEAGEDQRGQTRPSAPVIRAPACRQAGRIGDGQVACLRPPVCIIGGCRFRRLALTSRRHAALPWQRPGPSRSPPGTSFRITLTCSFRVDPKRRTDRRGRFRISPLRQQRPPLRPPLPLVPHYAGSPFTSPFRRGGSSWRRFGAMAAAGMAVPRRTRRWSIAGWCSATRRRPGTCSPGSISSFPMSKLSSAGRIAGFPKSISRPTSLKSPTASIGATGRGSCSTGSSKPAFQEEPSRTASSQR